MFWGALQTLNLPISAISWKGGNPNDLKIAKVTPIYNASDNSDISDYRPISVLPWFSKILERLMYKYLKEDNILYEKQFGFQSRYSTNDAIVQLVDKIFYSFEKEQFILGVTLLIFQRHLIQLINQSYWKIWNFMA